MGLVGVGGCRACCFVFRRSGEHFLGNYDQFTVVETSMRCVWKQYGVIVVEKTVPAAWLECS